MKLLIFFVSFFILNIFETWAEEKSKLIEPAYDNYVHLFVSRSPSPMNWESPSMLAVSLLKNAISGAIGARRITVGHVNLEVFCKGKKTYMGMHYRDKKEALKLLFKDKTGLGFVFHNMIGRYDNKEDIRLAKEDFVRGKTSVLTFKITNEKCQQLEKYSKRFQDTGEQFNYGLVNNSFKGPSKIEMGSIVDLYPQNENGIDFGGGCSAFVMSVLQEMGIDDMDSINQWYSKVRAPEFLVGQHSDQIYLKRDETKEFKNLNIKTGIKVSLFKVMRKGKTWAKPEEPGRDILYYSPNRMFEWIRNIVPKLTKGSQILNGSVEKIISSPKKRKQQAYQIIIDHL